MNRYLRQSDRSTLLAACLASLLAASFATGATTMAKPAPATSAAVPSDTELAATQCAIGEEHVLPGDY